MRFLCIGFLFIWSLASLSSGLAAQTYQGGVRGAVRVTVRVEVINVFDDPAFAGPRPAFGAPGWVLARSTPSTVSPGLCN